MVYINDPKFSDSLSGANSADPDQTAGLLGEQSDQGLHCLFFHLHLFQVYMYVNANLRVITINFKGVRILGILQYTLPHIVPFS